MLTPVQAIVVSLVVSILIFGLKWVAFRITGSVALYSDALESTVNIFAAGVALVALRVSKRPPDHNHPFGHTKAEYFSAVLEGVLISLAAIAIVNQAVRQILHPHPVSVLGLGVGLSLLASLINAALAWMLIYTGKRNRSPAVEADGRHVLSDVVTSVAVVLGVVLAGFTGWWLLDPLLALAVALHILWIGWRLVRESVSGLMDEGIPEGDLVEIRSLLNLSLEQLAQEGSVLEIHDMKTRRSGPRSFVEFHLVVPGSMTVEQAHQICDRIENALKSNVSDLQVTIHVEPDHKAKHSTFRIA